MAKKSVRLPPGSVDGSVAGLIAVYNEASALSRHYSSMRFVVLTQFVAIQGGLLAAEVGMLGMSPNAVVVRTIGVLSAIIFALIEWRVGMAMEETTAEATTLCERLVGGSRVPIAPSTTSNAVKWALVLMWGIYGVIAAGWGVALLT